MVLCIGCCLGVVADTIRNVAVKLFMAMPNDGKHPLRDENTFLYLCGLTRMEKGVDKAFADICGRNGLDGKTVQATLL